MDEVRDVLGHAVPRLILSWNEMPLSREQTFFGLARLSFTQGVISIVARVLGCSTPCGWLNM